ncbi:hypothetical protein EVAR_9198_1 [Eumeta japonica]|uniref:FLYWCH-type domain-containing protein n=1 Tax=Eumeta variegata TaxID=151549 RepID=A0A4C1WLF1_EUMVA|nr:hypothetical protein EVAR_9198_1 [Eumeta japonica]
MRAMDGPFFDKLSRVSTKIRLGLVAVNPSLSPARGRFLRRSFGPIRILSTVAVSCLQLRELKSRRGRTMVMYQGYTYNFQCETKYGRNWVCSSRRHRNCKAAISTTDCLEFIKEWNEHNHHPPAFHVTSDGNYVRI